MNRARILMMMPLLLTMAGPLPARACPFCESERAEQVRAGLAGDDLGVNAAATLLPFIVLAGVIGAVHGVGVRPGPKESASGETP